MNVFTYTICDNVPITKERHPILKSYTVQEGFHEEVFEPAEQENQAEVHVRHCARYGKCYSLFHLACSPE